MSFASITETGGCELMKSKRHSPEQVIKKLAEGGKLLNEGATVAEVARSGLPLTGPTWGSIFWEQVKLNKNLRLIFKATRLLAPSESNNSGKFLTASNSLQHDAATKQRPSLLLYSFGKPKILSQVAPKLFPNIQGRLSPPKDVPSVGVPLPEPRAVGH